MLYVGAIVGRASELANSWSGLINCVPRVVNMVIDL